MSSEIDLDCVHNLEMMNEDGGGATKHSTLPAYENNNYRNKHNHCPVSMLSGNGELKPCLTLIICGEQTLNQWVNEMSSLPVVRWKKIDQNNIWFWEEFHEKADKEIIIQER